MGSGLVMSANDSGVPCQSSIWNWESRSIVLGLTCDKCTELPLSLLVSLDVFSNGKYFEH